MHISTMVRLYLDIMLQLSWQAWSTGTVCTLAAAAKVEDDAGTAAPAHDGAAPRRGQAAISRYAAHRGAITDGRSMDNSAREEERWRF